mgnify:FL=1
MATIELIKHSCPTCGQEFDRNEITTINSLFDPSERALLLSGILFDYVCPFCHKPSRSMYPLCYTNPTLNFMVYLDTKMNLAKYSLTSGYIKVDPTIGYRCYGATSIDDVINKIVFLENKIDPRLAELIIDYMIAIFKKDHNVNLDDNYEIIDAYLLDRYLSKGKRNVCIITKNKNSYIGEYPSNLIKSISRHVKGKLLRQRGLVFDREDFLNIKDWTYSDK